MTNPTEPRAGLTLLAVHFGMFDYSVRVVIGPAPKAIKWVRWYYDDPDAEFPETARGSYFRREGHCGIVWIPARPKTPVEYGTLAHEVVHAVSAMFEWATMDHKPDSEETFAHAVGFLVRAILSRDKKWRM